MSALSKRYACTYEGCSRTFTRQEHLQRHRQNHQDGDFTCQRCRAHFKRRDLLDRHLTRHRQKDEEGRSLMTRKRMWKDDAGNIVTKRPNLTNLKCASDTVSPAAERTDNRRGSSILMSPPTSLDIDHASSSQDNQALHELWAFDPEGGLMNPPYDNLPEACDFWETAGKLSQDSGTQQQASPYEDIFQPDTASSFNMPFTTMSNYNWLFDMDVVSSANLGTDGLNADFHPREAVTTNVTTLGKRSSKIDDDIELEPWTGDSSTIVLDPTARSNLRDGHHLSGSFAQSSCSASGSTSKALPVQTTSAREFPPGAPSSAATSMTNDCNRDLATLPRYAKKSPQGKIMERPMAFLRKTPHFPKIDEIARAQVLQLIESARPMTPDGKYIESQHPRLSISSLQTYCDLYFSRFNTAYPLLHQASFEPSQVETLLLVAVLLLGATYCEKDAHQLAVCIHDVLRPRIFLHSSFNARPELWVLQTILLVECFGKSRAGQKQHDMSHLFHGLLINLIRRSNCQTVQPETLYTTSSDLEDDWRAWCQAEQKKRLALLCFMWDTQHAVLFCQSLCMSSFELRSSLPCDQAVWEAGSAQEWKRAWQQSDPPPLMLSVLKSYLTAQMIPPSTQLNGLSRLIVLHGLMSISWDMGRRDQTSLGLVGNESTLGDWRRRLGLAYDTWKRDFDAYANSMSDDMCKAFGTASEQDTPEQAHRELYMFVTANNAIYHAAHVILKSDFLDLQIYAGAKHILGRPVGRADYTRSQRVVKKWATQKSAIAAEAAWHAASIIAEGSSSLDDFDGGGLFHYPWCLYLATITVWSFYHARPNVFAGSSQIESAFDEDDEIVWDPQSHMIELIDSMVASGPERLLDVQSGHRATKTAGLTAVIANHLGKIRWAVVHDAMLVLRGLVPWRLISNDETTL